MANTLLTPTIIAKEMLIALENNLVLANLVHRDYSREFQKIGATVLVRKPTTFTASTFTQDSTVTYSTATESSVAVVLDTHLDITVPISTFELSLNIVDFSEQFIQPIAKAHAQAIDAKIATLYADVAGHFAASTTASVSDITNLRKVQNILKVPMTERRLVFHPATEARYLPLDAFLHAEKRGGYVGAIKEADIGRVLGYDTFMDQNIPTSTTGGFGASTATLITGSTGTVGASIIKISGGVLQGTVNAGDVFKVTGYDEWFVASAAATASNATPSVATVSVAPVQIAAMTNGSAVTFQQTHKASLAFHKNAFALVTAPLAPPLGSSGQSEILNFRGLSCRVVYGYQMDSKKNLMSIDLLCGVKTLDRNLAARLSDAN